MERHDHIYEQIIRLWAKRRNKGVEEHHRARADWKVL
jgi:hypothetical protein